MTPSGVMTLESAVQIEEKEVSVEKEDASGSSTGVAAEDIKVANQSSQSGSTESLAEDLSAPLPPPPSSVKPATGIAFKTKKVVTRHELTVTAHTPSLSSSALNLFKEAEGMMASTDSLVIATANARNELEEYVYEARSKSEEGGAWENFGESKSRAALASLCSEMEDWLYGDEGESATKSLYKEKLGGLKVKQVKCFFFFFFFFSFALHSYFLWTLSL